MTDIYRDTDERYQRDPAFYSAVRTLEVIAREHGFTPGELRQIAFKAALNLELTSMPTLAIRESGAVRICARCRQELRNVHCHGLDCRVYCSVKCLEAAR